MSNLLRIEEVTGSAKCRDLVTGPPWTIWSSIGSPGSPFLTIWDYAQFSHRTGKESIPDAMGCCNGWIKRKWPW